MRITFFVPGVPAPGGSKRAFAFIGKDGRPHSRVTDDAGQRNKDWRATVALVASLHFNAPLDGPLGCEFCFVMPRLRGHYGTGRNAAVLKPGAPKWPTVKPDVLKLTRSTEDALTGIAWRDDALVAWQSAMKLYGDRPGCWISVTDEMPDPGAPAPATIAVTPNPSSLNLF